MNFRTPYTFPRNWTETQTDSLAVFDYFVVDL